MDLIEQSTAPRAAPMFTIPQKTPSSVRLVVDYRRLKAVTVPDPDYIPRIEDTLERMAEAQFFSTFDLARGFYQVPLEKTYRTKPPSSHCLEIQVLSDALWFPEFPINLPESYGLYSGRIK